MEKGRNPNSWVVVVCHQFCCDDWMRETLHGVAKTADAAGGDWICAKSFAAFFNAWLKTGAMHPHHYILVGSLLVVQLLTDVLGVEAGFGRCHKKPERIYLIADSPGSSLDHAQNWASKLPHWNIRVAPQISSAIMNTWIARLILDADTENNTIEHSCIYPDNSVRHRASDKSVPHGPSQQTLYYDSAQHYSGGNTPVSLAKPACERAATAHDLRNVALHDSARIYLEWHEQHLALSAVRQNTSFNLCVYLIKAVQDPKYSSNLAVLLMAAMPDFYEE
eukprot:TRINITY_DN11923_c0_g2_i1.p1 TRINITY_DN11923_c0_g2~~TRINITY_DN11923_c0_g2_i1.p1  ORF type:complete len:278 (+),score=30.79 TRINITY_DN11923_c0_g2_i1:104-937(+)